MTGYDWAFAQRGYGVIVMKPDESVEALEFNEFVRRVENGRVSADDMVVSSVLTDGERRRVGDMRLYALIRSGRVPVHRLPQREQNGVIATGSEAERILRSAEDNFLLGLL